MKKINLINKHDNETMYFGKIADELIRYNRIQQQQRQQQSCEGGGSLWCEALPTRPSLRVLDGEFVSGV